MSREPNTNIAQAQQLLKALRDSYVSELPEKVDNLETCLLRLDRGEDAAVVYEELYRQVHSLKGSAGTYGIDIITTVCHQFEDYLSSYANTQGAIGERMVADSLLYIDILRQALELDLHVDEMDTRHIKEALSQAAFKACRPQVRGLILDASLGYARMYQNALSELPVHFTVLNNGIEALELLLLKPFDLLITSYHLELLNGVALTSALRRSGCPNADIGVVLLTSDKQPDTAGLGDITVLRKDKDLIGSLSAQVQRLSNKSG